MNGGQAEVVKRFAKKNGKYKSNMKQYIIQGITNI